MGCFSVVGYLYMVFARCVYIVVINIIRSEKANS